MGMLLKPSRGLAAKNPLVNERVVREIIANVAASIRVEYLTNAETGFATSLTFVPILTGAIWFCSELLGVLHNLNIQVAPMMLSSYGDRTTGGPVSVKLMPDEALIRDRVVIIIDDILDRGATAAFAMTELANMGAADIKTAFLLRKECPGRTIRGDFVGFDIKDQFVVGCGLDFEGFYRNLPDIRVLE